MKTYFRITIFALVLAWPAAAALAVPPPDFIFNIGSQIVQFFTFLILAFSVILGAMRRFFQTNFLFVRYGKIMWLLLVLGIVAASIGGAYWYSSFRQQKEYDQWIQQSRMQENLETENTSGEQDNLDRLKIGELRPESQPDQQASQDPGEQFIREYYRNIGAGNLAAAYAVSTQQVTFEVYRSWYAETTGVSVDSVQKISENSYSLGLTLQELSGTTRYAVLTKLKKDEAGNFSIDRSDVRVLADVGSRQAGYGGVGDTVPEFFAANQQVNLEITNEEFKQLSEGQPVFVLDAREDEEYAIGHFPSSNHIRFADLKAGEWIRLPQDRVVYVFCWSGMRGREVAEFLRTKNIVARFVSGGADGWVDYGGSWTGGVKFLSVYSAQRYQTVYSTEEVRRYRGNGVMLVDSRHPEKFRKKHIAGSVSIPVIYTPTSKLDSVLSQVPAGSTIITICDDFISCFDAKITGVKLEKRGVEFIGRYNKPWEYTE
jgi:rhodanese-related sulfurtransferase